MRFKSTLLVLAVCFFVCAQARADFSQFGTFSEIDGHGPNGTHQTWDDFEFIDPDPADHEIRDIPADHFHDSPAPTASVFAELAPGDAITELFGPVIASGTVYAAPQMELQLYIPNVINEELTKVVQTTLRYRTSGGPGSGYVDGWLLPIQDTGVALAPAAGVETTVNGWTTLVLEWQFPQIYQAELITIQLYDKVLLDRVVVETQCIGVPVPGAVLLGLLGLAAAGRKLRALC